MKHYVHSTVVYVYPANQCNRSNKLCSLKIEIGVNCVNLPLPITLTYITIQVNLLVALQTKAHTLSSLRALQTTYKYVSNVLIRRTVYLCIIFERPTLFKIQNPAKTTSKWYISNMHIAVTTVFINKPQQIVHLFPKYEFPYITNNMKIYDWLSTELSWQ